jgi:hypothetical protein
LVDAGTKVVGAFFVDLAKLSKTAEKVASGALSVAVAALGMVVIAKPASAGRYLVVFTQDCVMTFAREGRPWRRRWRPAGVWPLTEAEIELTDNGADPFMVLNGVKYWVSFSAVDDAKRLSTRHHSAG